MRIFTLTGLVLAAILSSAALAAPLPSEGWYAVQPVARPGVSQNRAPHILFGAGVTAGMVGQQAVYVANNEYARAGMMRREISAEALRGKRVRVSLRLKQEGDARAWTGLEVVNSDTNGITPANQKNAAGSDGWETHQFVIDVPRDAVEVALVVGFSGHGRTWVDGVTLEAVGADVAADETRRVVITSPPLCYRLGDGFSHCV